MRLFQNNPEFYHDKVEINIPLQPHLLDSLNAVCLTFLCILSPASFVNTSSLWLVVWKLPSLKNESPNPPNLNPPKKSSSSSSSSSSKKSSNPPPPPPKENFHSFPCPFPLPKSKSLNISSKLRKPCEWKLNPLSFIPSDPNWSYCLLFFSSDRTS